MVDGLLPDYSAAGADNRYQCGCGREYPAVWFSPRSTWVAPKMNPCAACTQDKALQARQKVDSHMRAAGFDDEQLVYDFSRLEHQAAGVDDAAFIEAVKGRPAATFGVLAANRQRVEALGRWDPRRKGVPRALLLTGPPGSGKSTLLAMMARRLLQGEEQGVVRFELGDQFVGNNEALLERLREIGRDFAFRRRPPVAVRYVRLEELVDAQRQRDWKADPFKAVNLAKFQGVLFVDELAAADEPKDVERAAVEQLINRRSMSALPIVLASNRSQAELAGEGRQANGSSRKPWYSTRVADRLKPGRCVYLAIVGSGTGESWR